MIVPALQAFAPKVAGSATGVWARPSRAALLVRAASNSRQKKAGNKGKARDENQPVVRQAIWCVVCNYFQPLEYPGEHDALRPLPILASGFITFLTRINARCV